MKHLKIVILFALLLSLTACGQTDSSTESGSDIKQREVRTDAVTSDNSEAEPPTAPEKESETEEITGTVFFGSFPQNTESPEPIEWLVLGSDGDKVLLLTKKSIESLPWHNTHEGITWDGSDIRAWLNGEFLQTAFTKEEQEGILLTDLDNGDDLKYGTAVGKNTQDKVFLLSGAEIEKYFPSVDERTVKPTPCAISHGAYTNGSGDCAWWLRSPGMTETSPAYIASAGDFGNRAHEMDETIIGVRPAIWVKADSVKAGGTKNSVSEKSETSVVNASAIWDKYDKDPNKFTATYDGEMETVTGVVTYIGQDSHGTPSMEISDTEDGTSYVLGVFGSYDEMSSASVGDTVTITGSFHIMSSENMVVLKRCEIQAIA